MKLEILNQIFQEKNPTGKIFIITPSGELLDSGKQTGKFAVQYTADSKLYTYQYKSVYALAMRLKLIPDNNLDYNEESLKAIDSILQGQDFISICGLSDTINSMLRRDYTGDLSVEHSQIENDIYERAQYVYTGFYTFNMTTGKHENPTKELTKK